VGAYRRVYDSRHLQTDCQEPRSAPEPYARQSSMGYLYLLQRPHRACYCPLANKVENVDHLNVRKSGWIRVLSSPKAPSCRKSGSFGPPSPHAKQQASRSVQTFLQGSFSRAADSQTNPRTDRLTDSNSAILCGELKVMGSAVTSIDDVFSWPTTAAGTATAGPVHSRTHLSR